MIVLIFSFHKVLCFLYILLDKIVLVYSISTLIKYCERFLESRAWPKYRIYRTCSSGMNWTRVICLGPLTISYKLNGPLRIYTLSTITLLGHWKKLTLEDTSTWAIQIHALCIALYNTWSIKIVCNKSQRYEYVVAVNYAR